MRFWRDLEMRKAALEIQKAKATAALMQVQMQVQMQVHMQTRAPKPEAKPQPDFKNDMRRFETAIWMWSIPAVYLNVFMACWFHNTSSILSLIAPLGVWYVYRFARGRMIKNYVANQIRGD